MMMEIKSILAECKHIAYESLSDDDIPAAVQRLADICQIDTGVRIHAIKRGISEKYVPAQEVPDLCAWHMRRLTGNALPSDPVCVKKRTPCFALIVDGSCVTGNPIAVESWMREAGIEACATCPTCCKIVIA